MDGIVFGSGKGWLLLGMIYAGKRQIDKETVQQIVLKKRDADASPSVADLRILSI